MIIVLNGPLGIGKTTTARALATRFDRAVMMDADHVADIHPFDYYNQSHLDYVYETLSVLMRHHFARGYRAFVVNWVFESAEQLNRLTGHLAPLKLPVERFCLTCDPETLETRIRRRNLPNVEREVQRGRQLTAILEKASQNGDLGTHIDTSELAADAVADLIWRAAHRASPGLAPAVP